MPREYKAYLRDILEACRKIEKYSTDIGFFNSRCGCQESGNYR